MKHCSRVKQNRLNRQHYGELVMFRIDTVLICKSQPGQPEIVLLGVEQSKCPFENAHIVG